VVQQARYDNGKSNHHTLSLYVADGYESYQKTPGGWKNGGGRTVSA
jgi:hypothetical protein